MCSKIFIIDTHEGEITGGYCEFKPWCMFCSVVAVLYALSCHIEQCYTNNGLCENVTSISIMWQTPMQVPYESLWSINTFMVHKHNIHHSRIFVYSFNQHPMNICYTFQTWHGCPITLIFYTVITVNILLLNTPSVLTNTWLSMTVNYYMIVLCQVWVSFSFQVIRCSLLWIFIFTIAHSCVKYIAFFPVSTVVRTILEN